MSGIGSIGGYYSPLDDLNQAFLDASNATGLPADFIKAIAMEEQGWGAGAVSPSGATGIMQVMPNIWGAVPSDGYGQIMQGAQILAQLAANEGGRLDQAAMDYLGRGGADAFGTTSDSYWAAVSAFWEQLKSSHAHGGVVTQLAENGPEFLDLAGGGQGVAWDPGRYAVPKGSFVSPAPASRSKIAAMARGAGGDIHLHGPVYLYPASTDVHAAIYSQLLGQVR